MTMHLSYVNNIQTKIFRKEAPKINIHVHVFSKNKNKIYTH